MQESVNERIRKIAESCYKGNINELCRTIDVKQATMSNIVAGRMSKPSFEVIAAIIERTPVSADWLITGQGEMLRSEVKPTPEPAQEPEKPAAMPSPDPRLLALIESQQKSIESLSRTIEALSKK